MATLADSLRSSTGRRLALRARPDLVATKHRYQGRTYWIVKEPIGLHYYRFQEEEYAILKMLDGENSLDFIKSSFEEQFPPQKIKLEELGHFVGMLHRSGLVLSDSPGQGLQLKKRDDERRRMEWVQRLSNILSLRFRGINPDRILNWLHPKFEWLYTPTAVFFCGLLAFSALMLVMVNFQVFRSKLPTFHQFFTPDNAFLLMVVLGVTKVIHEFGHGLSCKHFGGECHEMGVMLLVLTPCLYCNVSDSWMLPNKWHRAIIGAAGMYIEVVIASICTFVWWYTQSGVLHNLCLSAMFICSVSTIMFNGNPLLRYDGYYILSDVAEIPNLSQKATSVLTRWLGEHCLGMEMAEDPFLPQRNQFLFATYAISAVAYRWVVVFSIMFFLNTFFKQYNLQIIGQMMTAMSLFGLAVYPLYKLVRFFMVPGRLDLVDRTRALISFAILGAVVAAIAFVPLPHRVYGTLELEPHGAENVYVSVPGALQPVKIKVGQKVTKGTILGQLENVDLKLAVAELTGRRNVLQTQVQSLQQRRYADAAAGAQLPEVLKTLAGVEEQLTEKQKDVARLDLVAPIDGTVLPPPDETPKPTPEGELTGWSGSPFQPKNQNAYLDESTLFCRVGDPRSLQALVIVDQSDVEFLREGMPVDIKLDEIPFITIHSEVRKIATESLDVSPKHLSNKAGGELATKTDESGIERPISTSYQVHVYPLDDSEGLLCIGLRGRAKIHVAPESLGLRLWRWFNQTFHFRL